MNRIRYLDRTTSTQDVLHQLAADGAPPGTAVVAAEQGTGRGSRGRPWHSPRGGLWVSILLRPATAAGLDVLSLRVGLAVARTLETLPQLPPIALKWPNDLMLIDRKVGGILCEARWQGDALAWVAVGLGLNVTNTVPTDVMTPASRLADFDPELTPRRLTETIVHAVLHAAVPRETLDDAELAAFAERDWLRGRELEGPVPGRGAGITRDGALLIRALDGQQTEIRSGSVVVLGTT